MIKKLEYLFETYLKDTALWLFVVFLLSSVILLNITYGTKEKILEYDNYIKSIYKIILLDTELNELFNRQIRYQNFDDSELKIKSLTKHIDTLDSKNFYSSFGSDLKDIVKSVKRDISKKIELLERYKSYSATLLSNISYIYTNAMMFNNSNDINTFFNENVIDKSVYNLLLLYSGLEIDKKELYKQIDNFQVMSKNDRRIQLFYQVLKDTTNALIVLKNIKTKLLGIKSKKKLLKLQKLIKQRDIKNIKKVEKVLKILLIASFSFLVLFLYKYLIFLKNMKKLTSFQYAVENSDNSVVITDTHRNITYVNKAFEQNTGYLAKEAIGQNPRILKSGLTPKEFYIEMNKKLDSGQKWSGEFVNKDKYGKIFYEKASITPMFQAGKLIGYLAIKLNITDYIEQEKRVAYLAYHDQLTGLKNRRAFIDEAEGFMRKAKENNSKLALLFIDIDNFKLINDTLGHNIGDELLISISKRLENSLDSQDGIYRLGGDEFAVVLQDVGKNTFAIAKRVMDAISKPISIKDHTINTTASIGIATYPDDGGDIKTILKNADIAMYRSKLDGKNRYKFFYKNLSLKFEQRAKIEQELPNAIKNGEFSVVYQPKYSLEDQKIYSLELLIRWNSSKLGFISPEIFIPIAESSGYIYDIGTWTFEKACSDFKEIKSAIPTLSSISVNLSTKQLNHSDLINDFEKIVKKYNLSKEYIALEITETSMMENFQKHTEVINRIKNDGYKICMDDFGTGYSSLNYLRKLPIYAIKIDKSFIDVMFESKKELDTIKAIVSISKTFEFKTVAEGIETKEQEDTLKEIGVDYGQGYCFSKPLKKDELLKRFTS